MAQIKIIKLKIFDGPRIEFYVLEVIANFINVNI